MASLIEIMQLCRLCLVKDQVNIPIFEEQGDIRQIFLKISACLPVKVSREDDLPKKICDGCSYKLEILYQFWNTSANSEKQLLKWLSQVGAEKAPASDKVAVAPVQPHSMPSDGVILKQEVVDLADSHSADEIAPDDLNVSNDAQDYIMQQQQLSYQPISFQFQQDGFAEGEGATNASGPSATVTSQATEAAPKRKRRAAAMKALPAHIDSEEEDEDDVDMVETKIAKTEEQSDDSGGEDPEPTAFVGVPSTSTDNEQPGPSGVGKGPAEAPKTSSQTVLLLLVPHPILRVQSNTVTEPKTQSHLVIQNVRGGVSTSELAAAPKPKAEVGKLNAKVDELKKQYSCILCEKTFTTKKDYYSHLVFHGTKQVHTCMVCSQTFSSVIELKNHMPIHSAIDSKVQSQKEEYTADESKPQSLKCNICDKMFATKRYFVKHMTITHSTKRPYSCKICSKPFKHQFSVKSHMRSHSTQPHYKCEVCEKPFKTQTGLKMHSIKHGSAEQALKNKCQFCEKSFFYPSALESHIRSVHSKLFECKKCNLNFPTNNRYLEHIRTHTRGDRLGLLQNYTCSICKKGFNLLCQLNRHLKSHDKKRDYMCDTCGKTFTESSTLKNHTLLHSGIKSFQCNNCGKMFKTKKDLRFHMRVHTGERRYSCEVCKKKFTQRTTLVLHTRIHTGERPYKCNLCEKACISRCTLNTHKKSKHKLVS